jgi:hypothetical protein
LTIFFAAGLALLAAVDVKRAVAESSPAQSPGLQAPEDFVRDI